MKKAMRYTLLLLSLLSVVSCHNKSENIKIDKFVWIQHNQNWIKSPEQLNARVYVEYLENTQKVRMATTDIEKNLTNYFIARAPDSLSNIIVKNLYKKEFPISFPQPQEYAFINDDDFYCIIYKFSDGTERIMNYETFTLPDSLKGFMDYAQSLVHLYTYAKTDSFDRTSLIDKYRDSIFNAFPRIPLGNVKFSPPKIKPIED